MFGVLLATWELGSSADGTGSRYTKLRWLRKEAVKTEKYRAGQKEVYSSAYGK